jgi:hypothetical protein
MSTQKNKSIGSCGDHSECNCRCRGPRSYRGESGRDGINGSNDRNGTNGTNGRDGQDAIIDGVVWKITGNDDTDPLVNSLGTTNENPFVFATNNIAKMRLTTKGQIETLNTNKCVIIGEGSGENIGDDEPNGYKGFENTAIGSQALSKNTDGAWHTATGAFALSKNTIGSNNTAIGQLSLNCNIYGESNVGVGANTLQNNISGSNNTAIGTIKLIGKIWPSLIIISNLST